MWLLLIIFVISALIYLVRYKYSYWERKGLAHDTPSIPFGSLDALRRKELSFGLLIHKLYDSSKEKMLGIYLLFRPAILVRDVEIVRQVMSTEFAHFHDRGVYVDEAHDPMSANLFTMRGQDWKTLRTKLTPSFSSGKLKAMFGTIDDVGDKMVKYLSSQLENKDTTVVEMKSIFTTYAIDIIASVIFGLDVDSYTNPNNEFRRVSEEVFDNENPLKAIRNVSSIVFPPLTKFLTRLGVQDKVALKLMDIISRTIEYRETNKVVRKDLLQLLIQLRNTGKISEDDDKVWDVETAAESLKSMSIESITSNSFIFYIAGSETTAATTAFTVYEWSMHPELLKKAQTEVEECLLKHNLKPNDKLTYEAVNDMKYLDLCIMETTRKYPGLPFLNRECTQDYQVPGTNFTIEKGTPIIISLFGMHRDPEYFPNPMKYEPERFSEENQNYNPKAFMPFGDGPHHCIAQRMGKMNSKVALVKLLANFNVETNPHKELEFVFDPTPILKPKDGLNVRLSKKFKD